MVTGRITQHLTDSKFWYIKIMVAVIYKHLSLKFKRLFNMYTALSSVPYNYGDSNQNAVVRVQTLEQDANYLSFLSMLAEPIALVRKTVYPTSILNMSTFILIFLPKIIWLKMTKFWKRSVFQAGCFQGHRCSDRVNLLPEDSVILQAICCII